MRCPGCGGPLGDMYEVMPVHSLVVRNGVDPRGTPWETVRDRPVSTSDVIVQPCGCVLTRRLADALRS